MKARNISLMAIAALIFGLASCKKEKPETPDDTKVIKTETIRVSTDSRTGNYTLFSLREGKVIPTTDSATARWDFGIRFFTIIVNSHASGPGNAGVITQKGIYDQYNQAPTTGYAYDTTVNKLAINSTVQNGWFDYNPATHAFTPKAGMFFVFKTSDGNYAKVELLKAEYEPFEGPMPLWLNYTFRYTYQANGSTEL